MRRAGDPSDSIEMENRREINGLKDVLSQLNSNVATLTEATKGLKEVVDKGFNRQYDYQKASEQRVGVTEVRIDQIDIAMAKMEDIPGRVFNLETLAGKIEDGMNFQRGYGRGAKWAVGAAIALIAPLLGYLFAKGFEKVFLG